MGQLHLTNLRIKGSFARSHIFKTLNTNGGPGRTRTYDQGIHSTRLFLSGADYLITRNQIDH